MNHAQYNSVISKLETTFKCLMLVYVALSTFSFTIQRPIISLVMWPTFLLGTFIIANRAFHIKRFKTPYRWLLVALLFADAVTIVIYRKYSFKENVILLVLWSFYFLIHYLHPSDEGRETTKRELKILLGAYTVWAEICCIISLVMLFMCHQQITKLANGDLLEGFVYSRLYGVFTDPNLGAITVAVASNILLYAAVKIFCKKYQRIIIGFFIALNIFYIGVSDSRSGMVVCCVIGFVVAHKLLSDKWNKTFVKRMGVMTASVVIALVCGFSPNLAKRSYNFSISVIARLQYEQAEENGNDSKHIKEPLVVKRDYDIEEDISNRRFDVWKAGTEVFVFRPVAGISYAGIKDYLKENLPDNYLVNNDYMEMNTFDNDIMNVLVANGLIGFIPFVLFSFLIFISTMKKFVEKSEKGFTTELLLLSSACALVVASMFRSAIMYSNTLIANIFWTMLGTLVHLLNNEKKEDR